MCEAFFIHAFFCSRVMVLESAFFLVAKVEHVTLLGATIVGFVVPAMSSTSSIDVDSDELSSGVRPLVSYSKRGVRSSSSSAVGAFPSLCCTGDATDHLLVLLFFAAGLM